MRAADWSNIAIYLMAVVGLGVAAGIPREKTGFIARRRWSELQINTGIIG